MPELTSVQFVAALLLAALAGAVIYDVVFGRLDRIRARRAEQHAAQLQARIDRLEAARTVRRRRPRDRREVSA
jgi:formamidopyrimidine-DNA glycosylase